MWCQTYFCSGSDAWGCWYLWSRLTSDGTLHPEINKSYNKNKQQSGFAQTWTSHLILRSVSANCMSWLLFSTLQKHGLSCHHIQTLERFHEKCLRLSHPTQLFCDRPKHLVERNCSLTTICTEQGISEEWKLRICLSSSFTRSWSVSQIQTQEMFQGWF